jgi:kynurenine formamidase
MDIEFLVIKTGYCKYRSVAKYHNDNPGLESSLADVLKAKFSKLRGIGFDFISLTSWNYREHGRLSHSSFLGEPNNFLVIEDMDLNNVNKETRIDSIVIAPLRTIDGNGGPVTIIADINE